MDWLEFCGLGEIVYSMWHRLVVPRHVPSFLIQVSVASIISGIFSFSLSLSSRPLRPGLPTPFIIARADPLGERPNTPLGIQGVEIFFSVDDVFIALDLTGTASGMLPAGAGAVVGLTPPTSCPEWSLPLGVRLSVPFGIHAVKLYTGRESMNTNRHVCI